MSYVAIHNPKLPDTGTLQGETGNKPRDLSLVMNCMCLCDLPEKAMAPHSSTFAWKIPWMEEPGRLQSMGSLESDTTEGT